MINFLPYNQTNAFINLKCDYKYFVGSPEDRQYIKSSPFFKGEKFEYAYAVESFDPEATEIKVYIPKLMGNSEASPKTAPKTINKNV